MTGGALLLLATALLTWPSGTARITRRLHRVGGTGGPQQRRRKAPGPARQRRALAVAAGCALGLLVGGVPGVVVAIVGAAAADRLLHRVAVSGADPAAARVRDLPAACELVAVCLAAGRPVGAALSEVADVLPDPLAGTLREVAGLYRLGAEPRRAWAAAPDDLVPLGRVLVRAGESGSAAGPALRARAADVRAAGRAGTDRAVRRAGVWVLAPLGLCFLPAFVCLGVVPLVLGLAGNVFR